VRSYIPEILKQKIRIDAQNRCGYCLSPQHLVMARLEIEHIVPIAKGGSNGEANLWLACPICNRYKSSQIEAVDPQNGSVVALFNPRMQSWDEHFAWEEGGMRIVGKTAVGRATVSSLHLSDDPHVLLVRSYWIQAGWHPPKD
jgi:hypothetical protein